MAVSPGAAPEAPRPYCRPASGGLAVSDLPIPACTICERPCFSECFYYYGTPFCSYEHLDAWTRGEDLAKGPPAANGAVRVIAAIGGAYAAGIGFVFLFAWVLGL